MNSRRLIPLIAFALAAVLVPGGSPSAASAPADPVTTAKHSKTRPLVIAHRGASGYRPEHTLAAYKLAIRQCADYIEPDLVSTSDGVLVARHENEIGGTTDVEDHPEFTDRKQTKVIDGAPLTGWFTEDFTLAELKTLRAEERIPEIRPRNATFDGRFEIPTLQEVIDLAQSSRTCGGTRVGIYPETKHPTYFDSIDLSLEEPLVEALEVNGYEDRRDPVFVQSFEVGNLVQLDTLTDVRLVQLAGCTGSPADDPRPYTEILSRRGLAEVATYADGIGPCKDLVIPRTADGRLGRPTQLTRHAHRAGLLVHAYTFRAENTFLPTDYRSGSDPRAYGDLAGEIRAFLRAGLDGVFADHPDIAATAVRRRH
ncbi:MAG: glycerophosphodiester phosphodiesterase [Nocardioides sp.]